MEHEVLKYENSNFPVIACDKDLKIKWANEEFYKTFTLDVDMINKNLLIESLTDEQKQQFKNSLETNTTFKTQQLEILFLKCVLFVIPKKEYFIIIIEKVDVVLQDQEMVQNLFSALGVNYRTKLFSIFNMIAPITSALEQEELYKESEYMELVSNNCFSMLKDTINFLEFTKSLSNNYQIEKKKVEFLNFIDNLCCAVKMYLSANGIKFTYSFPTEKMYVCMDHYKLTLVLMNILSNSISYNNPETEINFTVKVIKKSIVFTIEDNGTGISAENLNKIFAPLYSWNANDERQVSTGLGLPLSKNIVDKMGGSFILSSKENEGTTVTIRFTLFCQEEDQNLDELNTKEIKYISNKFSLVNIFLSSNL